MPILIIVSLVTAVGLLVAKILGFHITVIME
jgi:hypothetical protein